MCVCIHSVTHLCSSEGTFRSGFSPSITWEPRTELRSFGLGSKQCYQLACFDSPSLSLFLFAHARVCLCIDPCPSGGLSCQHWVSLTATLHLVFWDRIFSWTWRMSCRSPLVSASLSGRVTDTGDPAGSFVCLCLVVFMWGLGILTPVFILVCSGCFAG